MQHNLRNAICAIKITHCMTNSLKNPFLIYGYKDPEHFCDRLEETADIISALRNGRNISLIAPRRMGKTGLIHNVFHEIRQTTPSAMCFYVDIFATKSLDDFVYQFGKKVVGKLDTPQQKAAGFITSFFKSAKVVFSVDMLTGMPEASLGFEPNMVKNTLEEIFAYLKQSEKECYVAIDEFQQILEYEDDGVEALLRSMIQFCPNVHFIFSGSKRHMMVDIFTNAKRPFFQSTECMSLHPIPEDSYFDFAERLMQQGGITLGKDVFHDIYSRFEGHTWYVQYLLNVIYEYAAEEIKPEDVNNALARILRRNEDTYLETLDRLSRNQASLLSAIAKEGIVGQVNAGIFIRKYKLKGTSSVNRALEYLIDKELVYKQPKGYIVYNRLLSLWLGQMY